MKKDYRRNIRKIGLFLTLMLFFTLAPVAKEAFALSVTPVRFEVSGNPGDIISEELLLFNETNTEEIFYSSFSNFEAQGESGNPAFVEPVEGLGTWMTAPSAIVIPPQKSVSVPFSITIPEDAEPGGHFAVIFFGDSPTTEDNAVSVGSKLGVLVLLSVNGDVKESAGLVDFKLKENKFLYNTLPVDFTYRFRNDGGDRIKPQGSLEIRNSFYIKTQNLNGNPVEGNILPNSTRKFDISWVKNPRPSDYESSQNIFSGFFDEVVYQWHNFAFGLYFAKLNLNYGASSLLQAQSANVKFFVLPWQLLLVLLVVFTIVWFGGKGVLHRYNRYIIEQAKERMEIKSTRSDEK